MVSSSRTQRGNATEPSTDTGTSWTAAQGALDRAEATDSDVVRSITFEPDGASPGSSPWEGLSETIPTDRTSVEIVSFVEAALIELAHEPVGLLVQSAESDTRLEVVPAAVDDEFVVQIIVDGRTLREQYDRSSLRRWLVALLERDRPVFSQSGTDPIAVVEDSVLDFEPRR